MLEELKSALYLLVVLGKLSIPEGTPIDVFLILDEAKNRNVLTEYEFELIIKEFDACLPRF